MLRVAAHPLALYGYLQLLDLLTTLAFLSYGLTEANPLVRWAIANSGSAISGLLAVKLLALILGALVWRMGRLRVLWLANLLFAALVVWNVVALILHAQKPALSQVLVSTG